MLPSSTRLPRAHSAAAIPCHRPTASATVPTPWSVAPPRTTISLSHSFGHTTPKNQQTSPVSMSRSCRYTAASAAAHAAPRMCTDMSCPTPSATISSCCWQQQHRVIRATSARCPARRARAPLHLEPWSHARQPHFTTSTRLCRTPWSRPLQQPLCNILGGGV